MGCNCRGRESSYETTVVGVRDTSAERDGPFTFVFENYTLSKIVDQFMNTYYGRRPSFSTILVSSRAPVEGEGTWYHSQSEPLPVSALLGVVPPHLPVRNLSGILHNNRVTEVGVGHDPLVTLLLTVPVFVD